MGNCTKYKKYSHMKKLTLTIGIPAYNAEKNIKRLLKSLGSQKETNYTLQEIIVYADGGQDNTVSEALTLKKRIKKLNIIDAKTRQGLAFGVQSMFNRSKADIFLLLNDDIEIKDTHLISKLVIPFLNSRKVGLVSSRTIPNTPQNFVQKAILSTYNAYDVMRYSFKHGNNVFTCDGKTLVLSKEFIKTIRFPKNASNVGNIDAFLYLSCIKNGFSYYHVREAVTYFLLPKTVSDYLLLQPRNNANQTVLKKTFGDLADREYEVSRKSLLKGMVIEVFKNPFAAFFIFCIGIYGKNKSKKIARNFEYLWETVKSTKKIFI